MFDFDENANFRPVKLSEVCFSYVPEQSFHTQTFLKKYSKGPESKFKYYLSFLKSSKHSYELILPGLSMLILTF